MESSEEEEVTDEEEDREGLYRNIAGSKGDWAERPERAGGDWESHHRRECMNPHCNRPARGSDEICCGRCTETQGREHSFNCNARTYGDDKRRSGRPWGGGDGGNGPPDRGDPNRRRGSGGGKPSKKPSKAARDRERNLFRKGSKGKGGRSHLQLTFGKALKLAVATATSRSRASRLRTWDRAIQHLAEQELVRVEPDGRKLNPELLKAGTAYLRARGYRSAELYASTAMTRHKAVYPVPGALEIAAREATRFARRGIGPPRGKQPAPMPQPENPLFEALCTGIWYLLRVSELTALNLGDVLCTQGPGEMRVALHVRKSKTDQEEAGELVARACTCEALEARPWCPAHTAWNHARKRMGSLREMGGRAPGAPLFTDADGHRLTQKTVTEAIEYAAARDGQEIRKDGWACFGSHSLRVAGAIAAFEAGLQEETVKALGRWTSTKAMYAYLRGTPYTKAAWASKPMAQVLMRNARSRTGAFHPLPMESSIEGKGKGAGKNVEELGGNLTVRNSLTGLIHRVGQTTGPPEDWITWCGWRWAATGAAGAYTLKDGAACTRCFRHA